MTKGELIKLLDEWKYGTKPIGVVLDAIEEYNPAPPPPVQSDSGVEEAGKGMGDYWGDQWVRMAELCRKQEKETKELMEKINQLMESAKEATEFRDELEAERNELREALEDALSNLNEIADCTNGRLREMAETAANKITKALKNNQ